MGTLTNYAIGKALKKARLVRGLTQVEVAERCGKTQSYVSKLEQGERSLMYWELFSYAYGLGMPPYDLFDLLKQALIDFAREELARKGRPLPTSRREEGNGQRLAR